MPKYVVSSTLSDPEWTNSTVIDGAGDVAAEIAKLKDEVDGDIVVHGSPTLARFLIEEDLVDELRLMVFPVVLGSGKELFGPSEAKKTLEADERRDGRRAGRADPDLRAGRLSRAAARGALVSIAGGPGGRGPCQAEQRDQLPLQVAEAVLAVGDDRQVLGDRLVDQALELVQQLRLRRLIGDAQESRARSIFSAGSPPVFAAPKAEIRCV